MRTSLLRPVTSILLAGAVSVLALSTLFAQSAPSPLVGRWKYNPDRSDYSKAPVVISGDPAGELSFAVEGQSYSFRIDGKEHPALYGQTATWRATGPRSWEITHGLKGTAMAVERMTLSPDGKTLTSALQWSQPKAFQERIVSERAGGGSTIVGSWRAARIERDAMYMVFTPADGGRLRINWEPWDDEAVVDLAGTEAPVTGPIPLPGMMVSMARRGDRSFEMTNKQGGTLLYTTSVTISPDGRTMTTEMNVPGQGVTSRVVFDRQ